VRCVLVSHFHWDREWYRSFEGYRARLVDAIDRVLDLLADDPEFRFVLDGQTILLDDYLTIRPARRDELARAIHTGRLAIGPWYVQPDSLLPSGESHVRNLLAGAAAAAGLGPVSAVAYVPDSFGHPAQLPQLFAGFGIRDFVHWRGSGNEIDDVGTTYRWVAPDGSAARATLLRDGYFNAACLPDDPDEAARRLAEVVRRLDDGSERPILLLNGFDHMPPDAHVAMVATALAARTGASVSRGLLEDALGPDTDALPEVRGDLLGARLANLLPGVWSARLDVKRRARSCERLLEGWAEPWAALAGRLRDGAPAPDERPALGLAWRLLLQCQAHDSLCGCSIDAVMDQVTARLARTEDLARQTAARLLGRLAGLGVDRRTPWTAAQDVAVFNPSPHVRTDVVRVPLDPHPAMRLAVGVPELPPLLVALAGAPRVTVDGRPARVVESDDPSRPAWMPGLRPLDVEFVARDVPAFGVRRVRLAPGEGADDEVDEGRVIETPEGRVAVADDGTLDVRLGDAAYRGLFGIEDRGDRGDTYDFDPVDDDPGAELLDVTWRRWRHPSGLQGLEVTRTLAVPRALDADRRRRGPDRVHLRLTVAVRLAPGVPRVDATVRLDNGARDHRLRLVFPTGHPTATALAATTFGVAARTTADTLDEGWVHPAPRTFPHQGWVRAGGLTVVAPGLPEAEVTPQGTMALTLLRAVGWLARMDLRHRPIPAGPLMPVAGAQCPGAVEATLALLADADPRAPGDAALGLWGVLAAPRALLPSGLPLLALEPRDLLLSACKPAERGDGIVVRVLNPTAHPHTAVLRLGVPVEHVVPVRLDEEPAPQLEASLRGGAARFEVPPHALRSVLLR
jgi:mannosylglycerate hydrolase